MTVSPFLRWATNSILVVTFAIGGLIHLSGHPTLLKVYDGWGFPREFNMIIGLGELQVALLLAIPSTRLAGSVIGAVVAISAITTVTLRGEYGAAPFSGFLLAILSLNAWISPATHSGEDF